MRHDRQGREGRWGSRRFQSRICGKLDLSPNSRVERLLAGKNLDLQGDLAIDPHGNRYVSSADTLYPIHPTEQP